MNNVVAREIECWGQPATDQEGVWLAEVLSYPTVMVTRPSEKELLSSGMLPYQCHVNCLAQQDSDLSGMSRAVAGWWKQGPTLVSHSVVKMGDDWLCPTPQGRASAGEFEFIPDPKIKYVPGADGADHVLREGQEIMIGLRAYPHHHIRMLSRFNALIAAGVEAMDAFNEVDRTIGRELLNLPLRAWPPSADQVQCA